MNAPVSSFIPAVAGPATPLDVTEGQFLHLPLPWIAVQPGFNPRTFFEDQEFAELVASVQREGVLHPLWVRPAPDYDASTPRFWLIAGERRLRAAQAAGMATVPVIVRCVGERQALMLAELENNPALRINLSPAEEARFAQRFVGACDGDRVEAATLLGWSTTKLDARLLLLHAAPGVLTALTQRHIHLGHAELLAGLPEVTQEGTLAKILSDRITVADLKARISGFALELAAAPFDITDCGACRHNSAPQAVLFAEALASGRCQNRGCYAEKTQAALARQKADLQTQYPAVFLDTERAADTYTRLTAEGPTGVGAAQLAACQGCQHYAAQLSTQPGREGQVHAPLCVHLACHRAKIAAVAPVKTVPVSPASPATARAPATPAPVAAVVSAAPIAQASAIPKKVDVWVDGWVRQQAARAVLADQTLCRVWLLYALYLDAGRPEAVLTDSGLSPGQAATRAAWIEAVVALPPEAHARLLKALLAQVIETKAEPDALPGTGALVAAAQASLHAAQTDLTAAFTPDAGFWQAHTKSGIADLLRTAIAPDGESFAAWYGRTARPSATDTQALERLLNGKGSDLIHALTHTAFDFSAWLPNAIARRFKAARS
ncbi:MAG TPA: PRTRC system ParB family protein [Candidatus Competibacter sp.]|uniref:ParB-like partition protein n=1 Tax=Candidatus Competibacter denitrificans Run_A_D11 TaxID=1400863 RepID=W6MBL2_9GAMM|nr:PRTRC system ParB family protein [Candidatus Competibacter denitrificans]CDI04369.1 putative ParB-like partition protein [Candidatus Competibacter denitrificans Run_A_D11]HRC71945.1 PRTRC system ParB family protein [Candidatus Competibacter sp.]